MTVLTGDRKDGWTLNVTDIEFRIIASVFKELIVISVQQPNDGGNFKPTNTASMASFACSVYNKMIEARGDLED